MNASIKMGLSTVALLVAGGLASYAPAAFAQVGPIKNTGNGQCLTATGTGGALATACNGTSKQVWTQVSVAAGVYLLRNAFDGRCLEVTSAGAVKTSPCNSGVAGQRWGRSNVTATTYRYKSALNSRFLTNSASGTLSTQLLTANPLQIWAF